MVDAGTVKQVHNKKAGSSIIGNGLHQMQLDSKTIQKLEGTS